MENLNYYDLRLLQMHNCAEFCLQEITDIRKLTMIRNYLFIFLSVTNACRSGNIENMLSSQIDNLVHLEFTIHLYTDYIYI